MDGLVFVYNITFATSGNLATNVFKVFSVFPRDNNLVPIEKRIDVTLCTFALLAAFSFFVWMSVPVIRRGVSSGDDANAAYIAKSLAVGRGYGFPESPDHFVLFESSITSSIGPTLILPVALLIWILGPLDQLPGAVTTVIFLGQLIVAAIILYRRFGWAQTCGFLSATIWLLMLTSSKMWLFGSLLGEPATFGFILIGTAGLVVAKRARGIVAACLCLSLALVTKQIALFPVTGILGTWVIVSWFDRVGLRVLFRRAATLVLATSSLPLAFEATKLFTLGLAGYRDRFRETLNFNLQMGVGSGTQIGRWTSFRSIFLDSYVSATLLAIVVTGSVVLLVLARRSRDQDAGGMERFALLTWAAAVAHLAYVLILSILWERYFWIGIALLLTAICAPLLAVESKLRVATILVLLVGTIGFGLHRPLYTLRDSVSASTAPTDRAAVVKLLDEHPELPIVAQYWASIFDVLYLRDKEGTWFYAADVVRLQHRDFIAVINDVFTDKKSRFFKSVVSTCEPLRPEARVISAYRCSKKFWSDQGDQAYPDGDNSNSADVRIPYSGAVDTKNCEVVGGWITDRKNSAAQLKVEFYIDDKLIDTAPATSLRPDLTSWGNGLHGFSFKIPAAYKDGKPHSTKIKVAGTDYEVPFLQNASGLQCPAS